MTYTVSISELRDNIATYLNNVSKGARVIVKDEKRNTQVAQITAINSFNKTTYEKALRKAAGIFTTKNHAEWATRNKVGSWLHKSRKNSDRSFK